MIQVHDGQCGLCTHFGEHHGGADQLVQIRTTHEAPEHLKEECGHPSHAPLQLMVTPDSGCTGFERADGNGAGDAEDGQSSQRQSSQRQASQGQSQSEGVRSMPTSQGGMGMGGIGQNTTL